MRIVSGEVRREVWATALDEQHAPRTFSFLCLLHALPDVVDITTSAHEVKSFEL